jgi:hypothetical protein
MSSKTAWGRHVVVVLGLILVGTGLLAVAHGLRVFQQQAPLSSVLPTPTGQGQRLIPTPTALAMGSLSPSSSSSAWPPDLKGTVLQSSQIQAPSTSSELPGLIQRLVSSTPTRIHKKMPTANPTLDLSLAQENATTPQPTPTRVQQVDLFSPRQRIGFVAPMLDVEQYNLEQLGAGWYLPCRHGENPLASLGMECAQLVVVTGSAFRPEAGVLQEIARREPGKLWFVGNEPDVIWQGNATPQEYAKAYHDVVLLLKEADPTCQVAIGAISQVTPLRLRYLEAVLAAYREAYGQPMPVDIWNIHLAILREERGKWGVDIPPGMPDDTGLLYEIKDNANIEILKDQVFTFRRWMAGRGLRNSPLIVTEFSVLMPPDYGFPLELVQNFMVSAFDFLMTAVDVSLGHPADGNRLVQRWAWYSLADRDYYTGNLFDPKTLHITPLGQAFAEYSADW